LAKAFYAAGLPVRQSGRQVNGISPSPHEYLKDGEIDGSAVTGAHYMKRKRALAIISAFALLGVLTHSGLAQSPPPDSNSWSGGQAEASNSVTTEQLSDVAASDTWLACDVLLCEPQQPARYDRLAWNLPQLTLYDTRYGFHSDAMTGFGGGEHHPMRRTPSSR
jgi:hypothetical protein